VEGKVFRPEPAGRFGFTKIVRRHRGNSLVSGVENR
jgi:hypothetical protein